MVRRVPKRGGVVAVSGDIEALLEKIFLDKGRDFRGYKRSSVSRRIAKRFSAVDVSSCEEYAQVLDTDPAEYARLFSSLTIKVSEFFREPEVFDALGGYLASFFPPDEGIKAWSCGCAHGQEAYSLAMVLTDVLSPEGLSLSKVLATDIDKEALEQARKAVFSEEATAGMAPGVRQRYFIETEGGYKVKYNIRNLVRFGALDIVRDPTIAHVNLLLCRNMFIYFGKPLQERVFEKLDYSLETGGILVLGKAEILPASYSSNYIELGDGHNIFRKLGKRCASD